MIAVREKDYLNIANMTYEMSISASFICWYKVVANVNYKQQGLVAC